MRVLAVLLLLLPACAFAPQAPGYVSDRAVVLTVPAYEQQGRFDCGHATLSMLFAYYAHRPDPARSEGLREVAQTRQGASGGELCDFLEAEGFEALLFSGELSHEVEGLYYHLDRGRPLLVCIGEGGKEGSRHYVLVVGYDPETRLIFLQDPARGGVSVAAWQFERAWEPCQRFCLLATPAAKRE